jgi:hypothetical protein
MFRFFYKLFNSKQDRQLKFNVTLGRIRATTAAVEKK